MIETLIHAIHQEAPGIVSLELAAPELPDFTPGAHIDLHLPNGLVRAYSLLPPKPGVPAHYRVAVLNVPAGRGGSACVHDTLRAGQSLSISAPRNHFPCDLAAEKNLLLAGGIGITPLYTMAKALLAAGREVELIYCARGRSHAAFLEELGQLPGLRLSTWFDDEQGAPPDIAKLLAGRDRETRFYACGPAPMIAAYEAACAAHGFPHAALERFSAPDTVTTEDGGFTVVLRKSGQTLQIAPDQTVLDTLLNAGIACDFSCQGGVCGACEVTVLDGVPEHRDFVLTDAEHEAGNKMIICVSRCIKGPLVLDL